MKRNTKSTRGCLPQTAHRLSVERRLRPREPKLLANEPLRDYVQAKLKKKWSPERIDNRLVKDFCDSSEMRASTETIYQAIYVHARGELRRELARDLRRGRVCRKRRRDPHVRRPRFVDAMKPISKRPAEIETRSKPGHREGDLVIGAAGGSAIATLVERSSRVVVLGHLEHGRSADLANNSLINTVSELPHTLRSTLICDQGLSWPSIARPAWPPKWKSISVIQDRRGNVATWQRGSNENTNGLPRQDFPRGLDLSKTAAGEL